MIWEVHGEIPRLTASIETLLFISTTGKIFSQTRKALAGIIANCLPLYGIVLVHFIQNSFGITSLRIQVSEFGKMNVHGIFKQLPPEKQNTASSNNDNSSK